MSLQPTPRDDWTGPRRARPKTAYNRNGTVDVPLYGLSSKVKTRNPAYHFGKDPCANFLTQVQKNSKRVPGPGAYEIKSQFGTPSKKGSNNKGAGLAKRESIIDEVARIAKKIPGPSHYKEIKYPGARRVTGGKLE